MVAAMSGRKIFISYRRADSQWAAARLYDTLAAAFPEDEIFMDVEEIAPGQDFVQVLEDQVGACDVFLALIGRQWIEDARLGDERDFVSIEIEAALARTETLTIPILLDGAAPPDEADLPGALKPLARRQFARLTHEGFRMEAQALIGAIGRIEAAAKPPPAKPNRSLKRLAPLLALPLIAGLGWLGYDIATTPPDPADTPDLATFRECEQCPEMVALPAGSFLFGSPDDEPNRNSGEGPQKKITLARFAIARTETTLADYNHCVAAGACEKIPQTQPPYDGAPAAGARLVDAQAYVAWLNTLAPGEPYAVPSEAQWEYAARGGTVTPYPWGDAPDRAYANMGREVCCIGHAEGPDEWKYEAPVASFRPNPWGLHDMAGNLTEWTADTYSSGHEYAPEDGAALILDLSGRWGRRHVIKGGSYGDRPWQVRPAWRNSNDKEWRLHQYGFRVVRDLTPR